MLPNRTVTNPSQLIPTSSIYERAQHFLVLVVRDLGIHFNDPVHLSILPDHNAIFAGSLLI